MGTHYWAALTPIITIIGSHQHEQHEMIAKPAVIYQWQLTSLYQPDYFSGFREEY